MSSDAEARPGTASPELRDRQVLARLWAFMRPYRALFLVALAMLPIASGLSLVQPHLIQIAVDEHITVGRLDGLGLVVVAFGAAIIGAALVEYAQVYLMQVVAQRALRDLRQRVFEHLMRLRLSYFQRTPTGRIMTRVTSDIESLQEAFASGMVTMLGDLVALVAIVVILLVKSWQLALVTFCIVPVLLGVTWLFRALMRGAFRAVRVAVASSNAFLQEAIGGTRIVQLNVQERRMREAFEAKSRELRDASFDAIRWDAAFYALIEAISSIAVGALIWYGAGGALEGALTLGLLIGFVEYVEKFFRPIRDLTQKYALLQNAMVSSERVFELLDLDETMPESPSPVRKTQLEHGIEFRNVWFSYDPRGGEEQAAGEEEVDWILRDVSFELPVGSRLALVGHTGAGKSTITRLLTRQYDVQRGQILIDGVDIRDIALEDVRRLFKVVHQDVFLFRGTLEENITLRSPEVSVEDAAWAVRMVQAEGFVSRLPGGLGAQVREGGQNLSAGERQLVSFARALAHKPQVLVLDEATASIDPRTEHALQEATQALLSRQTSVVVAHRLSTIRHCERILVMHHGELREQGTHEELLARGGLYETLYRLQYASGAAA